MSVVDKNKARVKVGSTIRLLKLSSFFLDSLPEEERAEIETMIGKIFSVYEIDDCGMAWIEYWCKSPNDGSSASHSFGLSAHEFELVLE